MLRLIFAICLCSPIYALVCTATAGAADTWDDTSVWTNCGGGVPGNGDVIVLSRPITLDSSRTVGMSKVGARSDTTLTSIVDLVNTSTVNWPSHGFLNTTGQYVAIVGGTVDTSLNGVYAVTYVDANSFTITTASVDDATYTESTLSVSAVAIYVASGGSLTIPEGTTLSVRGSVSTANPGSATYVLDVYGGTFQFDPTAASNRTVATFVIGHGGSSQTNAKWRTREGATGTRATFKTLRTNGDEARAHFSNFAYTTRITVPDFTDTDFSDLGTATTPMIRVYASGADTVNVQRNTFTSCGLWDNAVCWAVTATINFTGNVWASTLSTETFSACGQTAVTSGSRVVSGNVFDKVVKSGFWLSTAITYNVFGDRYLETTAGAPASFEYNFIFQTQVIGPQLYGALYKNFAWFNYDPGADLNGKGLSLISSTINQEIDGCVMQVSQDVTVDDMEVMVSAGPNAALTKTVRNCVVLRSSNATTGAAADAPSGPIYVGLDTNLGKLEAYHNTFKAPIATTSDEAYQSPIWFSHPGETSAANSVTAYKSNLMWDDPGMARGWHMHNSDPTPDDAATPSGVTHNASTGFAASVQAGSTGSPYNIPTTAMPGLNTDVNNVPANLVDPDWTMEKFAVQFSQPRTPLGLLAAISADPVTRIPLLIQQTRIAALTQNPRLWTAAHDGDTIGAVSANGNTAGVPALRHVIAAAAIF
jgi:hypothetical protein